MQKACRKKSLLTFIFVICIFATYIFYKHSNLAKCIWYRIQKLFLTKNLKQIILSFQYWTSSDSLSFKITFFFVAVKEYRVILQRKATCRSLRLTQKYSSEEILIRDKSVTPTVQHELLYVVYFVYLSEKTTLWQILS